MNVKALKHPFHIVGKLRWFCSDFKRLFFSFFGRILFFFFKEFGTNALFSKYFSQNEETLPQKNYFWKDKGLKNS
jgi:hypothetical protein